MRRATRKQRRRRPRPPRPRQALHPKPHLRLSQRHSTFLKLHADAPPTIDAALEQAYHSAAIYFPFADWIVADPYKEMSEGMKLAYYIGQSKVIGGTTTDMVAYIDHGVFIQAWIGSEDKLPRLLH